MKITHIDTWILEKPLTSSMQISRGGFTTRKHFIIQINTDSGITGLGEGIGDVDAIYGVLNHSYIKKIIDKDPCNINKIKQIFENNVYFERAGSAISAISAIEMACWDIKGKLLNRPVYDLLGGKIHEELEVYASDIYLESTYEMVQRARSAVEKGHKIIKVHLGSRSPYVDFQKIKVIKDKIPENIQIMVDLNAGYNYLEVAEFLRLIEPLNIKWLEEPTRPNYIKPFKSPMLIAAGENEFTLERFKQLFDSGAIDIAMPDVGRVGGLLATRDICTLAKSHGAPVSPHNYGSGILLAATIHLMASTENTWLLEMDNSENSVYKELLTFDLPVTNGVVQVPDCVGLGVKMPYRILHNHLITYTS